MANPKPSLSRARKSARNTRNMLTANSSRWRAAWHTVGDCGQYMKSGRQQKEEEKAVKKAARPSPPLVS